MSKPVQYHEGKFPPSDLNWQVLVPFIGPANASVGRYDGTLSSIPNANVLLSPLTTQEAVLSSRIEGTQATIGEVLEFEAKGRTGQKDKKIESDIWEIINYRSAMYEAENMMNTLPLCERIVKSAHQTLMSHVRGFSKSPGQYRTIPNWIGAPGCKIEEAKYIPISAEKLPEAMSRWEAFIHENDSDKLIQIALLHAEFEALHPFLDGNGRLGRMLIPLTMKSSGLIHSPIFYISAFFEKNRDEYYERLLSISRDGDWTGWCVFFLKAIQEQAEINITRANSIIDLYNDLKPKMSEWTHSQYAIHTLDWIFEHPIFNSSNFVHSSSIPKPTASRIINVLKKEGILKVLRPAGGRRAAVLVFPELLNKAEGHNVF